MDMIVCIYLACASAVVPFHAAELTWARDCAEASTGASNHSLGQKNITVYT